MGLGKISLVLIGMNQYRIRDASLRTDSGHAQHIHYC